MDTKKIKTILFVSLKVAVSATLLTIIFRKAGLQNIMQQFRSVDLRYFFLAVLVQLLVLYLATLRWWVLLSKDHTIGKLFSLYAIGNFFNNFLPGAIGGDAIKAYYLYKGTRHAGSSLGSVFMDRYIGLFTLLTMAMLSGLIGFTELKSIGMHLIIPVLFALFIAGSLIFFRLELGRRFSAISDFYDYFYVAIRDKKLILKVCGLSFVVQVLTLFIIHLVGLGIGQKLSFTAIFVFIPIIILITMIPLSISGLGIRESAFVLLFGLIGVPAEKSMAISFLWFLTIATGSLVGLVEYLRYRSTGRQAST